MTIMVLLDFDIKEGKLDEFLKTLEQSTLMSIAQEDAGMSEDDSLLFVKALDSLQI